MYTHKYPLLHRDHLLLRGYPDSPLRWTSKSTRALAAELAEQDHKVSHEKVAQILRSLDYRLQDSRKAEEGKDHHPDRDAQFQHISADTTVKGTLTKGLPVVSVDTKIIYGAGFSQPIDLSIA
ncbi:MAG TPA: hypothetical protein VMV90_05810 [Rectinemataceae bacterium]|nr:hypothetical protein [Rectinemataceae bacterium]